MSKIEESIEVEVPVSAVYELWTRFAEFPRFMSGVDRIDEVSETLTHWVTNVDGVHREFDARITEQIPDERIAWTSVSGTEQSGVVTFHRLGEHRARVMLQLDLDPHGVLDIIADRLGFVSHQVLQDLQEFKHFAESRQRQATVHE